jgi:hypothetical protein
VKRLRAPLLISMLSSLSAGCDEPERCGELREELLTLIRTECPQGSSCKGNPNGDTPTVPFSEHHYDILFEMQGLGCDRTDLGEAPWFCHNGEPACPTGYSCCFESLADVCRRKCKPPPDAAVTSG